LLAAPAAFAGPAARAIPSPPPIPPSGWNSTNVDVWITQRTIGKGTPSITFSVTGAQRTPSTTVTGYNTTVPVTAEGVSVVHFVGTDASGAQGGMHEHEVRIDKTPPVSTGSVSTTSNGFFFATIRAQDLPAQKNQKSSGVKEIRYNLNGVGPDHVAAGDSVDITLPQNGWTTLVFWAVDAVGNVEYPYNTVSIGPKLEVRPSRLDLTAPVGAFGEAQFLVLRNAGTAWIHIESITTDNPFFRVPQGACIFELTPGSACILPVEYFAPSLQPQDGTLFIRTDDYHQLFHTVELHGRGTQPGIAFSPDPVSFPATPVGSKSNAIPVQVINNGSAPLVISGVTTSSGGGAFPIANDGCAPRPLTLPPGMGCEVDVAFQPIGYGWHPGALEVTSNLPSVRSVAFEAFGTVTPQLTATPASLDFGLLSVGDAAKMEIQVLNTGPVPFPLQGFSFSGPAAAMYRVLEIRCVGGTPPYGFEPRQSCDLTVMYAPTAPGIHNAVLRANPSAAGVAPFDVPLTGEAQ
jgi:hypothetical protein